MKKDIFIITGKNIYSKGDNVISYIFQFDSGIDFDLISEYDYWGFIEKNKNGQWFITSGNSNGFKICGGKSVIKDDKFKNTVYLMQEDQAKEFLETFKDQFTYDLFHSGKDLKKS